MQNFTTHANCECTRIRVRQKTINLMRYEKREPSVNHRCASAAANADGAYPPATARRPAAALELRPAAPEGGRPNRLYQLVGRAPADALDAAVPGAGPAKALEPPREPVSCV